MDFRMEAFRSVLMASPGELVRILADVLGMPPATLVVYDRVLATEGLRAKSGRGWAAARLQPTDAANLITAVLGSGFVKDAALTVQRYSDTRPQAEQSSDDLFGQSGVSELAALPVDHSFVAALEALIASAVSGSLAAWIEAETKGTGAATIDVAPIIEIAATTPGTLGDIRIAGVRPGRTAQVRYVLPSPWDGARQPAAAAVDAWADKVRAYRGKADLEQHRRISAQTIFCIAEALKPEEK